MKRLISLLLCISSLLFLTACNRKMIGNVTGAEWDTIIIDDIKYDRVYDSEIAYSDKDKYLGKVSDGKTTFKVYSVKNDLNNEYLYCLWDYEGLIYRKKSSNLSVDFGSLYKSIEFKAQYIRTNATSYDSDNNNLLQISSLEEFNDYCQSNSNKYVFDNVFAEEVKKYDSAFFEKNNLILIVLQEGSGSVRHEVTDVNLIYSNQDSTPYLLQPVIKRNIPESGTCDMACWHIIVEISKEYGDCKIELKVM